jgi:tellurite resistance protein TerA
MAVDYTKRPQQPGDAGSQATPGVGSGKVILTKAAPTVSLTKHGAASGMMRVNLNWNARPAGGGGFFRKAQQLDLDLGCLYEFTDGTKGVVQALGNAFRARPRGGAEDVIWLDADDRSGATAGGENLFINLAYAAQIRRVMVFALIYEGAANWAAADGVVTLFPVDGPPVVVRLDEAQQGARTCAIAMLTAEGGGLAVRREVNYIHGFQSMLDRAYDWGLTWSPGSK